jgi:hypothetical protein
MFVNDKGKLQFAGNSGNHFRLMGSNQQKWDELMKKAIPEILRSGSCVYTKMAFSDEVVVVP